MESTTDSYGSFIFPSLSSGNYHITLDLPRNLNAVWTNISGYIDDQIPPLSIDHKDGASAACHIQLIVESSGSISGIIKAPGNKPIDGWVNANNVNASDEPQETVLSTVPDTNGAFRLPHLPPGRYAVQFTSRAGFVQGDLQIVQLKDGEQITGLILTAQ